MATVGILTIIMRLLIFTLSNVKHFSWCSCVLNIWVSRNIWIAKNLDSRLVSAVHDILFLMGSGQVLWSAIGYFHSMPMLHFANLLMSNHHNITNDILLLPVLTLTHNWYIYRDIEKDQGAVSIRKTVLPGMAIPMLKIRRPNGRLIFNMEITIRR